MTQYIDKLALVAMIKERIKTYNKGYANGADRRADALVVLLHDIDTLEVKEDLEIDKEHKIGKWFTGLIPCWIDAPSTLQAAHDHHGKNIVAIHLKNGGYRCCCVDDKEPSTFSLAEGTPLVEGWHNREFSAWNKEDEERIKNILSVLDAQECYDGATGKKMNPYQKEIDWLKSIKPINLRNKAKD